MQRFDSKHKQPLVAGSQYNHIHVLHFFCKVVDRNLVQLMTRIISEQLLQDTLKPRGTEASQELFNNRVLKMQFYKANLTTD